tara:strand:- start:871 stop:1089 length:219 start_codon:yes stop_codon:yes gene_type:complete
MVVVHPAAHSLAVRSILLPSRELGREILFGEESSIPIMSVANDGQVKFWKVDRVNGKLEELGSPLLAHDEVR